ncbi:hypothetical protein TNCV_3555851 [Trichonephila clavipes]|nr:hypothetical protein TNCV_3555851 [Trichonephila clavipes]
MKIKFSAEYEILGEVKRKIEGRGNQVVKVTDSCLACHVISSSLVPLKICHVEGLMNIKYVEAQMSSRWSGMEVSGGGVSSSVIFVKIARDCDEKNIGLEKGESTERDSRLAGKYTSLQERCNLSYLFLSFRLHVRSVLYKRDYRFLKMKKVRVKKFKHGTQSKNMYQ